ncbi:MAG: Clp protease N-terminal domain-containing protein [Microthrixaceae bacterium]
MPIDGPSADPLQGFSAGARRALVLAEGEARSLRHELVGTEHLLLGLLADDGSRAAAMLREAGTTLAAARRKVAEAVGPGHAGTTDPTSSPRAARAIGRAPRLARDHGADIVGEEHLLLAVLDVEGTAGQVLRGLGVDLEQLRSALGGQAGAPEPDAPPADVVALLPVCSSCHAALDAGVVGTLVPILGQASADEIVLLSCPDCGAVIATTPRQ